MERRVFMLLGFVCALGCERPRAPPTYVPGEYACTHDTKICSDGTPVGRVGKHCDWAPCPASHDGASFNPDGTQSDGQSSPPVPVEDADE